MDKDRKDQRDVLDPLIALMREFMVMVGDIGPYDEIVGVAIKGPDGQIRVTGK
jgi:hypothetical protein